MEGDEVEAPLGLPSFVWEEILVRVQPLVALSSCAQTSRFFRWLVWSPYFQVRYWRALGVWDVLRYKRVEESWPLFCQRTELERRKFLVKIHALSEKLAAFEQQLADTKLTAGGNARLSDITAFTYCQRGLVFLTNLREFQSALWDFRRASELYSAETMPNALNNMAVAYLYLGNLHGERSFFEAAEKILQQQNVLKSSISLGNRCCALIKLGRMEEALAVAQLGTRVARTEDGRNANVWHHKAFCFFSLNLFEKAVCSATKALKWNPNYSECYFTRGLALHALGREDEAKKDFERALELSRASSVWIYPHMYATSSELGAEVFGKPRNAAVMRKDTLDLESSSDLPSINESGDDDDDEDRDDRLVRVQRYIRAVQGQFGDDDDDDDENNDDDDEGEDYADDDDEEMDYRDDEGDDDDDDHRILLNRENHQGQ